MATISSSGFNFALVLDSDSAQNFLGEIVIPGSHVLFVGVPLEPNVVTVVRVETRFVFLIFHLRTRTRTLRWWQLKQIKNPFTHHWTNLLPIQRFFWSETQLRCHGNAGLNKRAVHDRAMMPLAISNSERGSWSLVTNWRGLWQKWDPLPMSGYIHFIVKPPVSLLLIIPAIVVKVEPLNVFYDEFSFSRLTPIVYQHLRHFPVGKQ